jgi:hypothetical protein
MRCCPVERGYFKEPICMVTRLDKGLRKTRFVIGWSAFRWWPQFPPSSRFAWRRPKIRWAELAMLGLLAGLGYDISQVPGGGNHRDLPELHAVTTVSEHGICGSNPGPCNRHMGIMPKIELWTPPQQQNVLCVHHKNHPESIVLCVNLEKFPWLSKNMPCYCNRC